MFAVAIGLTPFVVGVSVEPKSDTIILIPAAAYSAFTLERWASVNFSHSAAYVGLHQIRDVKGATTYFIECSFRQKEGQGA